VFDLFFSVLLLVFFCFAGAATAQRLTSGGG